MNLRKLSRPEIRKTNAHRSRDAKFSDEFRRTASVAKTINPQDHEAEIRMAAHNLWCPARSSASDLAVGPRSLSISIGLHVVDAHVRRLRGTRSEAIN